MATAEFDPPKDEVSVYTYQRTIKNAQEVNKWLLKRCSGELRCHMVCPSTLEGELEESITVYINTFSNRKKCIISSAVTNYQLIDLLANICANCNYCRVQVDIRLSHKPQYRVETMHLACWLSSPVQSECPGSNPCRTLFFFLSEFSF